MSVRRFAEGTTVPVETTKSELERLLKGYGADAILMGWDGPIHQLAFRLQGMHVRYSVERPDRRDSIVTSYPSGKPRPLHLQAEAAAAEERRRWRALLLIVKAKLEMIASGDATFADEFLPHVMLADGSTIGEWAGPQIEEVYRSGGMPSLLPGASPRALKTGGPR